MMTQENSETRRRGGWGARGPCLPTLVALALAFWAPTGLRAEPILSDRDLFLRGKAASDALDWARSVKYLHAYLQRNPPALDQVPGHRSQIEAALVAAETSIDATFKRCAELERRVAEASQRSDTATIAPPPRLDRPQGLSGLPPRRESAGLADEFDQLMVGRFLIDPGRYVEVESGRLSRSTFNTRQKGVFVLPAGRREKGIAILRSNRNVHGKLLFSWGLPGDGRALSLILESVTLYDKVGEPEGARRTQRIVVPPSSAVDLDSGQVATDGTADLRFRNIDGQVMFIEAVNDARLEFPMASLCAWCR